MRTTLLGMAAVAMMFASCAKNEVNDLNITPADASKINLSLSTGNVSRAVDNDLDVLEKDPNGFTIIGNYTDGTNLLSDTYKYDGIVKKWNWVKTPAVTDGYDWPTDATKYPVRFYGCFPYDLGITDTKLEYTPAIAATMADQKDYLFVTKEVDNKPGNGFTSLEFKHILSKMAFNIETKKGMKVYIQSIKIVNVANAGQNSPSGYYYNLQEKDGNDVQVGGWTVTDAPIEGGESYAHFTGATNNIREAIPTTAENDAEFQSIAIAGDETDGALMLLPQGGASYTGVWSAAAYKAAYAANPADLTAALKGARLEVTYRIVDADNKDYIGRTSGVSYKDENGNTVTPATNQYVRVAYELDLKTYPWVMNNQYTYTIKLGTPDATNGTLLDPNYKDDKGDDTTKPVDNPKTNPGKPVSSGKIGFEVSVSGWGTGATGDAIK